jgi:hypothetical protein
MYETSEDYLAIKVLRMVELDQQVSTGMLIVICVAMVGTVALKLYSKFKGSKCTSNCCTWQVETNEEKVDSNPLPILSP